MVLTQHSLSLWERVGVRCASSFVVLLTLSCLPRAAVHRLPQSTPVAVAYVMDSSYGPGAADVPPALRARVAAVLAERNLEARDIPFDASGPAFSTVRDSRRRYQKAVELAGEAPYVLLVETKASFFSQMQGRYRWMVYAQLTAGKRDGGEAVSAAFDQPAFVDFDHEREPEALTVAAPDIAQRAGSLFDSFLGTPTAAKPSADAIYFVMVDRFANGDSANDGDIDLIDPAAFHGGDLEGVLTKLDELQSLGVRTVWLSPVFQMRTSKFYGFGAFHGYWVEDLRRVEPRFGGEAALVKLSEELRRRGMRLMLDVVLNHVGPEAPLLKERPEWFHGKGPINDWNDVVQLTTHDVHGLPDLAVEREDVYRYLLEASVEWVKRLRPAGFRLDAVKHMPLSFWRRFNEEVRREAGPRFSMLGEMLDGDPAVLARTQREGKFDAMFDFPLYFALVDVFCKGRSPARLGAVLSQDRLYDDPLSLVTLADNHDLPRVMSDCGGNVEAVKQLLSVQLSARGTPSLTYGTEAGLTGIKEPENRGDMRFGDHPLKAHIRELLSSRARHPSLREGAPLVLEASEDLYAYARLTPREMVVVAVNQSEAPHAIHVPQASWEDLLTGRSLAAVDVPARSVRLALAQGDFGKWYQQALAQWRGKSEAREVEVHAQGAPGKVYLIGSGAELGAWNPAHAIGPADENGVVRTKLPVGSVYELKLVVRSESGEPTWEGGENRALFVAAGNGPLRLEVNWRKS
ncbi:MAG: alpha-amylase family glycosyl hydrolase [Myxococcota bacterium]